MAPDYPSRKTTSAVSHASFQAAMGIAGSVIAPAVGLSEASNLLSLFGHTDQYTNAAAEYVVKNNKAQSGFIRFGEQAYLPFWGDVTYGSLWSTFAKVALQARAERETQSYYRANYDIDIHRDPNSSLT